MMPPLMATDSLRGKPASQNEIAETRTTSTQLVKTFFPARRSDSRRLRQVPPLAALWRSCSQADE